MSGRGLRGIWLTLKEPNFARYIVGNGLSLIGTWMQRIAVGWLTWELTRSPTWLGIVAMADFFPVVLMGPLGGALADRFNRIRIMISAQIFATLSATALFLLSVSGQLTEWHLVGFTFCTGAVIGLNQASRMALAPSLVPRERLTTAIAINSMIFNAARFIGPVASTLTISLWSINASFAINALSYLALIIALLSLNLPPVEAGAKPYKRRSIWFDIREGLVFVFQNRSIGLIILMTITGSVCLRPIIDLLPGLTSDVFEKGVDGFATLIAAFGVGALLGGFWMAGRDSIGDQPRVALIGLLAATLANIGLVSSTSFTIALPITVWAGAGMVVAGIGMQSTLQLITPSDMRGRVLSLYGVIHIGGAGIGAFVLGLIAEHLGLRWPVFGAAIIGLFIWLWVWHRRNVIISTLDETLGTT
jgi:MFS family permease